jgi:transposase InsO family protein
MDERLSFVLAVNRGEMAVAELCRSFGISRKTGYKWIDRYRLGGVVALSDCSRAPKHHPNAVDVAVSRLIIKARVGHPDWGPEKLLQYLAPLHPGVNWPAVSTAAQILKRARLVSPRSPRRSAVPFTNPFTQVREPNDLWSADFKGKFRTGDGLYCHPLTISDNYSRYLFECRALTGYKHKHVRPWFERLFREYGLPKAIRTDNGAPFGSDGLGGLSKLNVWWLRLGITPEHIEPGKPQQNPRHERMHRTLKSAACRPRTDAKSQQPLFDHFKREYNEVRPHQSLKGRTPLTVYHPSTRPYPNKLPPFEYPSDMHVRQVKPAGQIRWLGRELFAGNALAGESVGLRLEDEGIWVLFIGNLAVGRIDARRPRIEPIRPYIAVPRNTP